MWSEEGRFGGRRVQNVEQNVVALIVSYLILCEDSQ